MIVADTNLISYLLIQGEHTDLARAVWQRDGDWRMPPLWRSEFLNVLSLSVQRKILSTAQATLSWNAASSLFARCEHQPVGESVLNIAVDASITAYDAQFVAVARLLGISLVTADKALLRACPDVAMSLTQFTR